MYNAALRPTTWDDYIGQEEVKARLQISINSSIARGEPLDHILLAAGPGTGKTTLAALIAQEVQQPMKALIPPFATKVLHTTLMEEGGVVFIDEAHRMKTSEQEMFLPILEDRMYKLPNGQGQLITKPFTIVAATTELTKIIKPLRDRFTWQPHFAKYTPDEMALIVKQMCGKVGLTISDDDALRLGQAAAGVPRQARNLVLTARDINSTNPSYVLETANITPEGFTQNHLKYLKALRQAGDVAGIKLIENFTALPQDILLELERMLVEQQCITYTPKGRSLLVDGMNVLKAYCEDS